MSPGELEFPKQFLSEEVWVQHCMASLRNMVASVQEFLDLRHRAAFPLGLMLGPSVLEVSVFQACLEECQPQG